MTKINKSELFGNAWLLVKEYNMNFSEALKVSWEDAKLNIEIEANGTSKLNTSKIDLVGLGTEFKTKDGTKWEVVRNKSYSRINAPAKIDENKFLCTMVDFGCPLITFSREEILNLTA